MSANPQNAPLEGVIVIEHANGAAGSYAGRILALMGATVIKVEAPGGDELRQEPPLLPGAPGSSVLFNYLNINKSALTLDIAPAAGQALLAELLERAAIFIDDTPLRERTALGIDPETLAGRHPDLVHVSVLPFGSAGPHSEYRAHELNVFHSGGEGYLLPNGLALDMFPDRPPVKIYGHFAELVGGISAADGALTALIMRAQVGGQYVDVSTQDANVAISCFNVQRVGDGELETRHGRSFRYGGVLQCADGYIQILTLEPRQWAGLVQLMGEPEWTRDPGLQDEIERGRRGGEINAHLRAWARTRRVADLVKGGQALNVPIDKYAEPAEILESTQFRAREAFSTVEFDGIGTLPVLTAPFQHMLPARVSAYPAAPGADNARIYTGWLGHDAAQLRHWRAEAVI
jgi:crotonobetainyl-CoA:carnitine CoA-transferase CaiB-like acyl-CoA transferase